ncbi:hypothetical protein [Streptomyces sp. NPDC018833]|uniref:hypothetical protein n=1 Tax=Streptomyces sp. NPDC018833 TaxID=3365053 RepID=UPI0037B32354
MPKAGRVFASAAAGCLLAVAALSGSAAMAQAAEWDPVWNSGPVRFRAANDRSECLAGNSIGKVGVAECKADPSSTTNWTMEPWNNQGLFQLRNSVTNYCLDMNLTEVYMSRCNHNDGGQVLRYSCDDGQITAMGPTSKVTWWNDKTVSASFERNIKTKWTAHPKVPQDCR